METKERVRLRTLGEVVAIVSVVASLGLVAYELRQSTIAARAAAFQELGIAISSNWTSLASDPEMNELWLRSTDSSFVASMTASEHRMLWSRLLGSLRMYETTFLQVELGLLDSSALESLGWAQSLSNNVPLRLYWSSLRTQVSPSFADFLETRFDIDPTIVPWRESRWPGTESSTAPGDR